MALDYKYYMPLHLPPFLKPKLFKPGMVEHTFNSSRGRQILSVQSQAVQHSENLFQKQQQSHELLIVNPSPLLHLCHFFLSLTLFPSLQFVAFLKAALHLTF